jgi:aryl-alcohol dehydrogenase-like predicted oxidoreductase
MDRRQIPNTTLHVSPLCLGTMTFGTPVGEADAIHLTHWALDHGINFIDTANMYEGYTRTIGSPGGVAEEILGKALRGRRHQVVLATKVGMKIGPTDDDMGLSRKHVLREIDRSLQRLGCDMVDLYYMHKPDPNTPLTESVEAFDDLVSMGKIRHWALSNFSAQQIEEVLRLCDQNGWRRPVALQPPYSLLKREIEADVLPLCARERIAVVPYQVLQGGLLTGKYRRGEAPPAGSRQLEKPEWTYELTDTLHDHLEQLEAEARSRGRSLTQHALLTLLEQPAVVSLIVGVKRIEQLEQLMQAVGVLS